MRNLYNDRRVQERRKECQEGPPHITCMRASHVAEQKHWRPPGRSAVTVVGCGGASVYSTAASFDANRIK